MQKLTVPLLTNELADRIERSDLDVMRVRMEKIKAQTGDPYGIEIAQFGGATALTGRKFPVLDFNRVYGMGPDEIPLLDEICAFYERGGHAFLLDVTPQRTSPELLEELLKRGFVQTGFHTALYGVPDLVNVRAVEGLEVRPVTEQDVELYGEIFFQSLGVPKDTPERKESNLMLIADPEWTLYLCYQGDVAIGFAMMQIVEGVAGFALAGTLAEYRGRGVQQALLHQRMVDATAAGAHLIVAQCEFGSVSQRNLQRAGFQVAYTKAVWQKGR